MSFPKNVCHPIEGAHRTTKRSSTRKAFDRLPIVLMASHQDVQFAHHFRSTSFTTKRKSLTSPKSVECKPAIGTPRSTPHQRNFLNNFYQYRRHCL
ncbi:unnamed protein product [Oikopleura dioica]|uniref:Uncharacterized protein n=1 Tax=Oikopleura dioica TaxID=34765 RepID=E4YNQ9_OIKDI|nr:unnamed protein product [Oikopleura dioica]